MEEKSYSINVEQSVLGAMMSSKDSFIMASTKLLEEDFYVPEHKIIFQKMLDVNEKNMAVVLTTLVEELKLSLSLEKIGGIEYLISLKEIAISSINIEQYIKILKDKTLIRRLLRFAGDLEKNWETETVNDVDDYVSQLETEFLSIVRSRQVGEFESAAQVLDRVKMAMTNSARSTGGLTGVTSGFVDLDKKTQGFQKGDMIILAARPSVGKTALALNFAINAALKGGITVAVFSLEMPAEQLMQRLLSNKSGVIGDKIRSMNLTDKDFIKIDTATKELANAKLFIDDTAGIKISDLEAKARKLKGMYDDLGLIVIDYMQLITTPSKGNGDSRQNEVSEISRKVKALARDLGVPIIALSQLSRSVEKREDKRPMLSDLRESGSIEQDADIVMFIYRDDYYNKKEDANVESSVVELNLAKHRNGPTGKLNLVFLKQIGKFSDYDKTNDNNG